MRAWSALILACVALIGCEAQQPPLRLQAGDVVPPLVVVDLAGRPVQLRPTAGRLLIVNVWATWCGPCRHELPSLQRLAERLDPMRFELVGLSVDDDEHVVREYLIERKIRFPSLRDPGLAVAKEVFGVRVFPSTFFIRPDGTLARVVEGGREWDSAEIVAQIEALGPPQGQSGQKSRAVYAVEPRP